MGQGGSVGCCRKSPIREGECEGRDCVALVADDADALVRPREVPRPVSGLAFEGAHPPKRDGACSYTEATALATETEPGTAAATATAPEAAAVALAAGEVAAGEASQRLRSAQTQSSKERLAPFVDGDTAKVGAAEERLAPSAKQHSLERLGGDAAKAEAVQAKPKPKTAKKVEVDSEGREIPAAVKKRVVKKPVKKEEASSGDEPDGDLGSCPASRKEKDFERELRALKKKGKSGGLGGYSQPPVASEMADFGGGDNWMSYEVSKGDRTFRKEMFISFYREQYMRLKTEGREDGKDEHVQPDLTNYSQEAAAGLKITDGHRPMPRPRGVKTPEDFRQPVGVLTQTQLSNKGRKSARMLICIHGDLFDVSDRPDKYGQHGPYNYMTGRDITWGLVCADDAEEHMDKYYDLFKIQPKEKCDRKLQGLLSWWAFYEKEYGPPVGRLDQYDREWILPPPPDAGLEDGCSVM